MPQDAFTLRLCARELDKTLRGGKINKINQPDRDELSLFIYTASGGFKLTISANASDCGIYFDNAVKENPVTAPNFCMLLRKRLSGAEILGVTTAGFERVIIFKVKCFSDFTVCDRELIVEVMGKYSNVLLVENGVLLGAMKTTSLDENCKRAIFAGAKYELPAPQDKVNPSDKDALAKLFSSPAEGDLAEFLFLHVAGLAPSTARQIVASYKGGEFSDHVHDFIFSDEVSPRVEERGGKIVDFYARASDGIAFHSLLEAETYYYEKKRALKSIESLRRKLQNAANTALKKQQKKLAQTLQKKLECEGAEENRLKGELITTNLYRLKKGLKSFEADNYYDEGKTLKILLDETLSPAQNAQAYFKRYRKQKRALEFLIPQEKEAQEEIDYLSSVITAVETAKNEDDLRCVQEECESAGLVKAPQQKKKVKKEIPFHMEEHGGFYVYAGRNNLQNDRLVRSSSPEDIWMHAKNYHSCHVIIQTEKRPVPDEVLLAAAQLCASRSSAKGGKIAVDYCAVKFVKKPPKSKSGFVTYSNYKTILVEI